MSLDSILPGGAGASPDGRHHRDHPDRRRNRPFLCDSDHARTAALVKLHREHRPPFTTASAGGLPATAFALSESPGRPRPGVSLAFSRSPGSRCRLPGDFA